MGYFSNGTEGEAYEARFCAHCVNQDGCWIWLQHLLHNYEEANKPDSFLHRLIPRTTDGWNGQCVMFRAKPPPVDLAVVRQACDHIADPLLRYDLAQLCSGMPPGLQPKDHQ